MANANYYMAYSAAINITKEWANKVLRATLHKIDGETLALYTVTCDVKERKYLFDLLEAYKNDIPGVKASDINEAINIFHDYMKTMSQEDIIIKYTVLLKGGANINENNSN